MNLSQTTGPGGGGGDGPGEGDGDGLGGGGFGVVFTGYELARVIPHSP